MRRILFPLTFCAVAITASAELQLNPQLSSYEVDGVTFPSVTFSDGDKKVTYVPPRGWDCAGSAIQLSLRPKNFSQADATVTRIPLTAESHFDEETVKKLIEQVSAGVPANSTKVQVVSQDMNPVVIDSHETFQVVISYIAYGETYSRSVLFLNRGKEELRFQLTAKSKDFPNLQKAFFGSHFTWQNL